MRECIKPTKTVIREDSPALRAEQYSHPAFGVITVSRHTSSVGERLFGSDLKHSATVHIEICRAAEERYLSNSRQRSDSRMPLVSFSMSEAQWARFVASAGIGAGTAVTLDIAPEVGARVAQMPGILVEESKADTARREMEATAADVIAAVSKAEAMMTALLSKPSINKGDVRAAIEALQEGSRHYAVNFGFAQEQFQRNVERVVEDAKTEVESFVAGVALNTGIEALRNGAAPVLALSAPVSKEADDAPR